MASKSDSLRPREVMAGAPMRTPPGASADTSPTTAFLFSVMCTRSHAFSILLPFTPCMCTEVPMRSACRLCRTSKRTLQILQKRSDPLPPEHRIPGKLTDRKHAWGSREVQDSLSTPQPYRERVMHVQML